ncbi:hypothetical protein QTP86_029226 [Hemibagrus guttatus]|nr:hypothetical protein QTP86_029226 [Hemibagrus guttatus]
MKCFKRLVMRHIKTQLPPSLDPLQFAYRPTRSTDDAITTTLHLSLTHLDNKDTYFADDTTVIGLIQDGDESAYRQEIEQLAAWCSRNNLELNTLKTVEMIVDFRRNTPALPPLTIMNSTVPTVASFRFLGTTISQDLKWDTHIDATIKKAQQRLYFLRQLRKFNLPQELLIHFYSAVIESVLCTSITVWFGSATKSDMRRLQRTVRTAERIIGAPLPTLQELYTSRSSNQIVKFANDTTVVGLISKNNESAYREEVQRLTVWCRANNLSLNVDKTKDMVFDFKRAQSDHSPLFIDGSPVEIVKSTKFLGVHLVEHFTWSLNISSLSKKAQQRLYFLRRLRKAHLPRPILTMFHRATIGSVLSSCITAWFGNCTVSDRKTLQWIVKTAEKIIGVSLPSITDMYTTR